MGRSELIVIIPAFREAGTIFDVVRDVSAHAPVIVVDDCSPDNTGELARAAGALVIRNPQNRGYEGSLNAGFDAAAALGCTAVLTMDADGEHDAACVGAFRRELLERDTPLVLGVRPGTQRFAEAVVSAFTWRAYGIRDIFCGMKGYHIDLWRRHGKFDYNNAVGTELALSAVRGGISFAELPVTGRPRQDAPRFDTQFRANIRIFGAVKRALRAAPIGRDR